MTAHMASPMNTPHPTRRMLAAAWQWRRNNGPLWALPLYGLVALIIFVVPAVAALVWLPPRLGAALAGVLVLAGLASVWVVHVTALLRLDHPHALHLVPGHRQAIRSAALGLWAVMVAAAALLAGLGTAAIGLGDMAASARMGLAAALITGTLLVLVAAGLRWWWLWLPASVLPWMLSTLVWPQGVRQAWTAVEPLWQAWTPGIGLLLLAVQGTGLTAIFGQAGPRHAQTYRQREQFRQAVALSTPYSAKARAAALGGWQWVDWPGRALADAWLRHCLAPGGSVMARAELVLHGRQHWLGSLATVLMVQAVLGLGLNITAALTGQSVGLFFDKGYVGITVGLGFAAIGGMLVLPMALRASRREQALLVLLPGLPRGKALNKALAWRQSRHALAVWLGLLPALAALGWTGHGHHALAWMCAALPVSAWLWRDYARMPLLESPAAQLLPMAAYVGLGLVSMWLLLRHPAWLGPWLIGLSVLTAALLVWRWRAVQHLPPALPVCRLT